MAEPELAAEVIGIWSMVHGLAGLMLAGQFDKRSRRTPEAWADVLVPALTLQFMEGPGPR